MRADRSEDIPPNDHGHLDHGHLDHGHLDHGHLDASGVDTSFDDALGAAALLAGRWSANAFADGRLAELLRLTCDVVGAGAAFVATHGDDGPQVAVAHGLDDTALDSLPSGPGGVVATALDFPIATVSGDDPLVAAYGSAIGVPLAIATPAGVDASAASLGALVVLGIDPDQLDARRSAVDLFARQVATHLELARVSERHTDVLDELDMAQSNLAFVSSHDPLTGLFNRRAVTELLDRLTEPNRDGTISSALLVIDLDNFEDINDSLGHDTGDRVLVTVADRIHLGARGDDTVARLASDQFVVVINDAVPLAPESLAKRLLHSLSNPIEHRGASVKITASIGIARWTSDVHSAGELLRSANAAMTYAKTEGRNRYVAFEDRVAEELSRRVETHAFVRRVVHEGGLRLDFQPMWSLSSGTPLAHEALLRWHTGGSPKIGPMEFVAAAEELGLVGDITRFTIHEACRLAARRRQAGERSAAVTVNLSSVQLERDEVILTVAMALEESGLHPSGLILELTESAKLAASGTGQQTLRELQRMGVRIALDDYGTGFSSLALLRSFPFDFMKIDKSFVSTRTETDREVLRSLVQLGHSLGMTVVAEGIEDAEVLEQLRLVGCDVAQGYLLGRPGSGEPPNNMVRHPLIVELATSN
jgi:diguanylate cyclase (GGDEF)-like protein